MRPIRSWTVTLLGSLVVALALSLAPTPVAAQNFAVQIQTAINQLTTGIIPFTRERVAANGYINWGTLSDANGYGIRDNAGSIQVKNSGGAWSTIVAGGGNPVDASYWTRVPESSLTNETALSSLATALLLNTNATGVPVAYTGTSCTNQFVRSLSAVGVATCASVAFGTDVSGTVLVPRGGTGITSGTGGGVLAFTDPVTIVSSAALTDNVLVVGGGNAAAPNTIAAGSGTTTTLLHGSAVGEPTWAAVNLATAEVTGILPTANGGTANAFFTVSGPATTAKTFTFPNATTTILTTNAAVTAAQGGTGFATYTVGDVLYADTTATLAKLIDAATGNALISGGAGVAPAWGKIGLTTHVTGTLPATSGGTGIITFAVGDLLYASSTTALARLAASTNGTYLRSTGAGAAPIWSTTVLPNAATQGDLMAASAANTYSNIAAVATGQVLASAGVGTLPAYTATPTVTTLTSTTSVVTPIAGNVAAAFRNRTSLAQPGALADGDWWVECVGVSPARVCAIDVRDGGMTRVIASITF